MKITRPCLLHHLLSLYIGKQKNVYESFSTSKLSVILANSLLHLGNTLFGIDGETTSPDFCASMCLAKDWSKFLLSKLNKCILGPYSRLKQIEHLPQIWDQYDLWPGASPYVLDVCTEPPC